MLILSHCLAMWCSMLAFYLKCGRTVFPSSFYSFLVGVTLQLLQCFSSLFEPSDRQLKLPRSLWKANLICTWIIYFFPQSLEDNYLAGLWVPVWVIALTRKPVEKGRGAQQGLLDTLKTSCLSLSPFPLCRTKQEFKSWCMFLNWLLTGLHRLFRVWVTASSLLTESCFSLADVSSTKPTLFNGGSCSSSLQAATERNAQAALF